MTKRSKGKKRTSLKPGAVEDTSCDVSRNNEGIANTKSFPLNPAEEIVETPDGSTNESGGIEKHIRPLPVSDCGHKQQIKSASCDSQKTLSTDKPQTTEMQEKEGTPIIKVRGETGTPHKKAVPGTGGSAMDDESSEDKKVHVSAGGHSQELISVECQLSIKEKPEVDVSHNAESAAEAKSKPGKKCIFIHCALELRQGKSPVVDIKKISSPGTFEFDASSVLPTGRQQSDRNHSKEGPPSGKTSLEQHVAWPAEVLGSSTSSSFTAQKLQGNLGKRKLTFGMNASEGRKSFGYNSINVHAFGRARLVNNFFRHLCSIPIVPFEDMEKMDRLQIDDGKLQTVISFVENLTSKLAIMDSGAESKTKDEGDRYGFLPTDGSRSSLHLRGYGCGRKILECCRVLSKLPKDKLFDLDCDTLDIAGDYWVNLYMALRSGHHVGTP